MEVFFPSPQQVNKHKPNRGVKTIDLFFRLTEVDMNSEFVNNGIMLDYYVPRMSVNLISFNQICKRKNTGF
jgi:hypothetical protein